MFVTVNVTDTSKLNSLTAIAKKVTSVRKTGTEKNRGLQQSFDWQCNHGTECIGTSLHLAKSDSFVTVYVQSTIGIVLRGYEYENSRSRCIRTLACKALTNLCDKVVLRGKVSLEKKTLESMQLVMAMSNKVSLLARTTN